MKWIYLGLLIFVALFFLAISISQDNDNRAREEFKKECDKVNGVVYSPKGENSAKDMYCVDKSIFLIKHEPVDTKKKE